MAEQVSVSSTIYNLAGDEAQRVHYLKSLLMGCVIQEVESVGQTITQGYLKGPGLRFRRFIKWVRTSTEFTNTVGVVRGNLHSIHTGLDHGVIEKNIPLVLPEYVDRIETAYIEASNLTYWVLKYLCANHPQSNSANAGYWTGNYSYKYNPIFDQIDATFPDVGTSGVTIAIPITDPAFLAGSDYLYVKYVPGILRDDETPVYGAFVEGWVSVDGYTQVGAPTTTGQSTGNLRLKETWTVTYKRADGTDFLPPESTVTETQKSSSIDNYLTQYFKDGIPKKHLTIPDTIYSERHWLDVEVRYRASATWAMDPVQQTVETFLAPDGSTITKTTRFQREYETFEAVYWTREDRTDVIHKSWTDPRYFIYRRNSGNAALDALFNRGVLDLSDSFYPPIPFRYANEPVTTAERGAKEWWVNLGPISPLQTGDKVHVKGGPLGDTDYIVALHVESDPARPGYYRIKNRDDDRPLSLALRSSEAQFQIASFGSLYVSDWAPFLSASEPVNEGIREDLYPVCKKAFRKAFEASFDKVQEQVFQNNHIDNIDHIYAVFGVSLNVKENACRKYVFKFMEYLRDTGAAEALDPDFEPHWFDRWNKAMTAEAAWEQWKRDGTRNDSGDLTKPPPKPVFPEVPWQTLRVETVKAGVIDYRTEIKWAFITETSGVGVLDVPKLDGTFDHKAKADELWFEVLANPLASYREVDKENPDGFNQRIRLNWQTSANSYRQLTITGLQHINYVYRNMKTVTTAKRALTPKTVLDATLGTVTYYEAAESPFLVPLHEVIHKRMGMVEGTQMATACCFLVFNCYEIDREEWYETWWFKVIIIAAIVVASVVTAVVSGGTSLGAGGMAIIGFLTAAGLGTTAAIIIAALLVTLAGMALSWVITKGSVEVFGDKWGPLIGAILSTVLTLGLSAGSLSQALELLSSPAGLMALGHALGNGTAGFLQTSAAEIREDTAKMLEAYSAKNAEVQRAFNEEFGSGSKIDPTMVNEFIRELNEKPELFLQRTLMTGSDIVEITLLEIENFAKNRLRLEMP